MTPMARKDRMMVGKCIWGDLEVEGGGVGFGLVCRGLSSSRFGFLLGGCGGLGGVYMLLAREGLM